jgi:hypothetical protein
MAELRAHGIGVGLPGGWDGRITVRPDNDRVPVITASGPQRGRLRAFPVAHFANFGLPESRGDFGSGAVELMGEDDVFVMLFEHEPEAAATALFRSRGLPRTLSAPDFDPATLRRGIAGQSAHQAFFQDNGRAFCLYVVLGSHARRARLIPLVNRLLATIRLDEAG